MSNISLRKKANQERKMRQSGVVAKTLTTLAKHKRKTFDLVLGEKLSRGQNVGIYKPEGLDEMYARKNLCLKVFNDESEIWGHPRGVGRSPIEESTKVQNLMAMRGLAPKIYDIIEIGGKTAQVTDYLTGEMKVVPISDERFHFDGNEKKFAENFIDGKFVDFQGTVFKDYKASKIEATLKAFKGVKSKGAPDGAYQSTKYFRGLRDTEERLARFDFKEFEGKTVLDIGCSNGVMSQEAIKLGAKRVVGLDRPQVVEVAEEMAIYDGFFNIDFFGLELDSTTYPKLFELTGIIKFDIHLFLAMENWIGWPEWVKNCDRLYYEGHGARRPYKVYNYKK